MGGRAQALPARLTAPPRRDTEHRSRTISLQQDEIGRFVLPK
jgi:hypothetical protein